MQICISFLVVSVRILGAVRSLVSYNAYYASSPFWQKLLPLQESARHCYGRFILSLNCSAHGSCHKCCSAIICSLEVTSSQSYGVTGVMFVEHNQINNNQFNVIVRNLR
jgi:hypothetical protein